MSDESTPILSLSPDLIEIFRKEPSLRTPLEVETLFQFMSAPGLRTEALLHLLTLDALKSLCATSLQFQSWSTMSIVFLQGSISNACYIILSGTLSIWVNAEKPPENLGKEDVSDKTTQVKFLTEEQEEGRVACLVNSHDARLGDCVAILKSGAKRSSFGEMGLIEGLSRSATIRAEGNLSCIRIDKDAFDIAIKLQLQTEFNSKMKILRSFSLFRWLSETQLKRIALQFKSTNFSPRTVIYKAGDAVDTLHFIVSGECTVNLDTSSMATHPKLINARKTIALSNVGVGQFVGIESVRTMTAFKIHEYNARQMQKPLYKVIGEAIAREISHIPPSGVATTLISPLLHEIESKYSSLKTVPPKSSNPNYLLQLTCTSATKVHAMSIRLIELVDFLGKNTMEKLTEDVLTLESIRMERIAKLLETEIAQIYSNSVDNKLNHKLLASDSEEKVRRISANPAALNRLIDSVKIEDAEPKVRRKTSAAVLMHSVSNIGLTVSMQARTKSPTQDGPSLINKSAISSVLSIKDQIAAELDRSLNIDCPEKREPSMAVLNAISKMPFNKSIHVFEPSPPAHHDSPVPDKKVGFLPNITPPSSRPVSRGLLSKDNSPSAETPRKSPQQSSQLIPSFAKISTSSKREINKSQSSSTIIRQTQSSPNEHITTLNKISLNEPIYKARVSPDPSEKSKISHIAESLSSVSITKKSAVHPKPHH